MARAGLARPAVRRCQHGVLHLLRHRQSRRQGGPPAHAGKHAAAARPVLRLAGRHPGAAMAAPQNRQDLVPARVLDHGGHQHGGLWHTLRNRLAYACGRAGAVTPPRGMRRNTRRCRPPRRSISRPANAGPETPAPRVRIPRRHGHANPHARRPAPSTIASVRAPPRKCAAFHRHGRGSGQRQRHFARTQFGGCTANRPHGKAPMIAARQAAALPRTYAA